MSDSPSIPVVAPASRVRHRDRGAGSARVSGLDFARFVALVGMMIAHVWALNANGGFSPALQVVSGKAGALFAVLAGVVIALTSRRSLADGRVWAARRNLVGRGLALVVIGLTLGLISPLIAVILVYYGILFWGASLMVRWSNRTLLIGAGLLAVLWPFASSLLRAGLPEQVAGGGNPTWLSLGDPGDLLRDLFLSGAYPVPTWIVYAMVGMAVGRLVLAAADTASLRRLGLRLPMIGVPLAALAAGVSALLAGPFGGLRALESSSDVDPDLVEEIFYATGSGTPVAGNFWWLASPAPHTGTFFDLAITVGVALAVIGLCLLFGTVVRGRARTVLEPIRRAGAAPLTVYTAHVVAASVVVVAAIATGATGGPGDIPWYISSPGLWALHIAGAILIGLVLALLGRRGPLETFVSWVGRLFSGTGRTRRGTTRRPDATATA